jgi:hypothetical protein
VSASAYHHSRSGKLSARCVEDERLTRRVREVHTANYECYGYRRVRAQLVRDGERAGRDRVVTAGTLRVVVATSPAPP